MKSLLSFVRLLWNGLREADARTAVRHVETPTRK
jgi:hypothetical protein